MYDQPGPRKVHSQPMLRSGGMALYFTFVLTLLLHLAFLYLFSAESWFQNSFSLFAANMERLAQVHRPLMALFFGTTIVYILGLYDDRMGPPVSVKIKLLIQLLAAFIALWGGIQVTVTGIPLLDKLITLLWIVGMTNAFNLLDNMNGLSTGVALIVSSLFLWVVIDQGQLFMGLILSLFIGCLIGFLPHNFPKAKIFLGDQGSLFIGYLLGCLTILESFITLESPTHFGILMPLFVMALPLFDTASVIFIRLKQKRPLFEGDTSHLSHRLVAMGLSQTMAVTFIYLLTLILGLAALLLLTISLQGGVILLIQAVLILLAVSILEFYGRKNKIRS